MIIMAETLKSFETRINPKPLEKETIHSGHFMVSKFEAEEPDDDDDVAVPVPDAMLNKANMNLQAVTSVTAVRSSTSKIVNIPGQTIAIETSLAKLFQCMSLAYRQKLTSPKWNRFKGIKLRWKDKIRLNNVIWRCWHMQFITKKNSLVCQFASPLDVDTHNKPEAVVLEGKYWKRKLNAVTAEYKKWRMFARNQVMGWGPKDAQDVLSEMDLLGWQPHSNDCSHMMVDEDYMEFMSDTLFSSIAAQPFAFPDPREIARGGAGLWADLIQPSLVQLQPNLDDDVMDTFEPLHDLLCSKLPPVPEEISTGTASDSSIQDLYRALNGTYQDMTSEPPPPPPPLPSPKPLAGRNSSLYRPVVKQEPQYPSYQYASQPVASPRTSTYKPYMPLTYNMPTQQPQHQSVTHYQQLSPPPPPPPLPPPPAQAPAATCIQSAPSPPEFKLPSTPPPSAAAAYPCSLSSLQRTNMRSNSLPLCDKPMPQRRATEQVFAIPKLKHRNRSRSGSSLMTPGKSSTPTLISAGSDPALNTTQTPNALLHQLLTTNNNNCNTATNYSYRGVSASSPLIDKSLADSMGGPAMASGSPVASYSGYTHTQSSAAVHIINTNTDSNDGVEHIMPDNTPVMYSSHSPSDTFTFSANVTTGALSRRMATNQQMPTILSQSPSSTIVVNSPSPLSISAEHSPQMVGSASNSPKHPDSPGNDSLSLSPLNVGSPNSPNSKSGRRTYKEHRRVCHINAEQKRRCTIKNGFDTLHALIPQLNHNPNAKLSKAAMLQKGAEYIRQLRNERNQLKEEMDSLRQQVECLNSAISNCQSMLPATGAPVSRHRTSRMKEMYNEYIRSRTQENWRFWLLSLICEPLLVSFNNTVSTASLDDLYRTTLIWVEQHCSLVDLRPVVLNALRHLCTSTEFLSDPTKLPSEAQAAAIKSHSSNSS
ncbi:MLX-interacting protein isoform X2 [Nilaparvata lugens]|uniref:MLX-interacting protein isoform X2 n=1 Tax=Nilaparvata lugens TaxID=108931 RepID=UPI00193DB754|nr:MLX-interacting protein isoform X2 [Nilaparvata lugens]